MIKLETRDRVILLEAIKKYIPSCEVRAFGSRITDKAQRFSDLDLVLIPTTGRPIELSHMALFQEALACSDMEIMVDVHDWFSMPESFQQVIRKESELFYLPDGATECQL